MRRFAVIAAGLVAAAAAGCTSSSSSTPSAGSSSATGTITGTITALDIPINQDFTTDVGISKTGSGGQCGLLTLDLAPINVDAAGQIVSVDLTAANVDA